MTFPTDFPEFDDITESMIEDAAARVRSQLMWAEYVELEAASAMHRAELIEADELNDYNDERYALLGGRF